MHYYTHHIGDYRKDTGHLTLLEHGIYRQMLDLYYLEESPLPSDKQQCMRLVCVRNADEMQAFENVLSDFFKLQNDGYHHKRCDKQLNHIYEKSEKARQSAKARWEKEKRTDSERNANALHNDANAPKNDANDMLPNDPITHKPNTHNKTNSSNKFDAWWNVYPKKVEKKRALGIWKRRKLDNIADQLIEDVINRIEVDRKWIDGYIPNPTTYLNGDRWQDQIDTTRGNNNGQNQQTSGQRKLSVAERATEARKQWERENPDA